MNQEDTPEEDEAASGRSRSGASRSDGKEPESESESESDEGDEETDNNNSADYLLLLGRHKNDATAGSDLRIRAPSLSSPSLGGRKVAAALGAGACSAAAFSPSHDGSSRAAASAASTHCHGGKSSPPTKATKAKKTLKKKKKTKKGVSNTSSAEERWEDMFTRLLQYREQHGDCHVPNRYEPDPKLGAWVSTQRRHYRVVKNQQTESNSLTAERIRRLEEAGFEWTGVNPRYLQWDVRYEEMLQFKNKYGHTNIPIGWSDNVKLANWTSTQRQEYKNKMKGKKTRLDDRRIQLLNDIGFSWELQRGGRKRKLEETSDYQDNQDQTSDISESSSTSSSEDEDAEAGTGNSSARRTGDDVAGRSTVTTQSDTVASSTTAPSVLELELASSTEMRRPVAQAPEGELVAAANRLASGILSSAAGSSVPGTVQPASINGNPANDGGTLHSVLWAPRPPPNFMGQQPLLQDPSMAAQVRALFAEQARIQAGAQAAVDAAASLLLARRREEIAQQRMQSDLLSEILRLKAMGSTSQQAQSPAATALPPALENALLASNFALLGQLVQPASTVSTQQPQSAVTNSGFLWNALVNNAASANSMTSGGSFFSNFLNNSAAAAGFVPVLPPRPDGSYQDEHRSDDPNAYHDREPPAR